MDGKALKLKQLLLEVNQIESEEMLLSLSKDMDPLVLIETVIVPIMNEIGEGWEDGTIALSQVYMSGKIIESWIDKILPPGESIAKNQPRIGIAVLEDYHLLGKRIIYSLLKASGLELYDYGHISVSDLVEKIIDDELEVILISTLMLPSALKIKELKDSLTETNNNVKIIVGGAPFRFDNQLWKDVGADNMATGASEIIAIINEMMEGKS